MRRCVFVASIAATHETTTPRRRLANATVASWAGATKPCAEEFLPNEVADAFVALTTPCCTCTGEKFQRVATVGWHILHGRRECARSHARAWGRGRGWGVKDELA